MLLVVRVDSLCGVLILNSFQSKAAIAINVAAFKQATYFHDFIALLTLK